MSNLAAWIAKTGLVTAFEVTVPNPHSQSYVMNAITGTQVPVSSYEWSQSGTQFSVAGLPISDQPQIIVMQ
jgi:hypothetical protein